MNEIILREEIKVENMIYEIKGKQVMLDNDVAMLFGYETKYLNRQVQRNIERFPENYCFQLIIFTLCPLYKYFFPCFKPPFFKIL